MDTPENTEQLVRPGQIFVPRFALSLFAGIAAFVVIGLVVVMVMLSSNRAISQKQADFATVQSASPQNIVTQQANPASVTSDQIAAICGGGGSSTGWSMSQSELGDNPQVWSNVIINDAVSTSTGGENNNQANAQVGDNSPNATSRVGNTISQDTNAITGSAQSVN